MNLSQVYRVLTSVLPNLQPSYSKYEEQTQPYDYIFSNPNAFKQAYDSVFKFAPFLIDHVTSDYLKPILKRESQYSTLPTNKIDGRNIISSADYLKESVIRYLTYIEPFVLTDTDENSIDVRFIHITGLDELEKTVNQLKRALNTPVFELDGRIEVQKIDSGSILITLLIGLLRR